KGLDISLSALQRQDPYIKNIVDVASQVALYTFNSRSNEWEKTEVEGALFVYTRLASPRHGFTIMNRLSMENLTEPITKDLDFQLQHPFLLYRNARFAIHGIWFYDKEDCQRITQRMKTLTEQEQTRAQSQVQCLSPESGGSETKMVDIIEMLTNARSDYEKAQSTPEPKEIRGSSVLSRNPNLIKPIPVKPNAQDSDYAKPRGLSVATLFGFQKDHQSSKPEPVSPLATPLETSSPGLVRPPVARTLTYEDASNTDRSVIPTGGSVPVAGSPGELGGTVAGPSVTQHQPDEEQPQQHCPAFRKLLQGQRGVGGGQNVVCRPVTLTSVPCSHFRAQQSHQSCLEHSRPQTESLHNQSASAIQGWSSQIPSVVSPHELLRKLQLVQNEQRIATNEPPRPCPGLAPRFLGPTQAPAEGPAPDLSTTAIKKAAVQIPTKEKPLKGPDVSPARGPGSVQEPAPSHAAHSDQGRPTFLEPVWREDQPADAF
ncbi:unnamed protein product, partial [Tetraodon nigroviridis]